jgi:hypothetical protein
VEALAGGVLLSLTLAALVSGEVASRQLLERSVGELEMERAAMERLEYLRAQPAGSALWTSPSGGTVLGHPEWAWTITPELVEDRNVMMGLPPLHYLRARVTISAGDGRKVEREALRW